MTFRKADIGCRATIRMSSRLASSSSSARSPGCAGAADRSVPAGLSGWAVPNGVAERIRGGSRADCLSGTVGGSMQSITRALTVIGVPCSVGAHHGGLERGPAALRAAGLPDRLRQAGWEVSDAGDLAPQVFTADAEHPRARNREAVLRACRDVAAATGQAIAAGRILWGSITRSPLGGPPGWRSSLGDLLGLSLIHI